MTVQAGRVVTLKAGGGSEVLSSEACTDSGDHKVYQVASAAKRAIDPGFAVEVNVGGVTVSAELYSVDYAHGVITFIDEYAGETPGAVTILSGRYLPLLTIANGKSAKISPITPVFADATQLGDTAPRSHEVAKQCTVEIVHLCKAVYADDPVYSLDAIVAMAGVTPLFLECDLSGAGTAGQLLRGWFMIKSWGTDHPVGGVEASTVSFIGVCRTCVGRPALFGTTSVDQALFSMR